MPPWADALTGSDRPLVTVSGTPWVPGRASTEADPLPTDGPVGGRGRSVNALLDLASRGVRTSAVRMPRTVHNEGQGGFAGLLADQARRTGVAGYPGDGTQRWPAVHALDAAVLFRLALESAPAGTSWHAVADEGDAVRDIADRHRPAPGPARRGGAGGELRPVRPDLRDGPASVQRPHPRGARLAPDAPQPARGPGEPPALGSLVDGGRRGAPVPPAGMDGEEARRPGRGGGQLPPGHQRAGRPGPAPTTAPGGAAG